MAAEAGGSGSSTDYSGAASSIGSSIGSIYNAWNMGKVNDRATRAQALANANALQFEREREAERKRRYEETMKMYQAQWEAYNARRDFLLQRYGIDIGDISEQSTPPENTEQTSPPTGNTLGDMIGG